MTTIRRVLAVTAFLFATQWSRPAGADATITGTVGEIVIVGDNNPANAVYKFKLTDATQTKACVSYPGYAFFTGWRQDSFQGDCTFREWYAMLLVSKKGAPISCVLTDNNNLCHVKSCTLP